MVANAFRTIYFDDVSSNESIEKLIYTYMYLAVCYSRNLVRDSTYYILLIIITIYTRSRSQICKSNPVRILWFPSLVIALLH